MSLEYISKSATDRVKAVGKEVLQNLNYLALHNRKQFEKVGMWAKMAELARGRLERKVVQEKVRNKAAMESLRTNMFAWKAQAEKMNAVWGEGARERRVYQANTLMLEREALELGDEVRSVLKKAKSLSSAEL